MSFDQGLKLSREIGASEYVECASLQTDGLKTLEKALQDLLSGGSKSKRRKTLVTSGGKGKKGACALL